MTLRLGSLFAGIAGFDLGMSRAGIQPVWAVEIDGACQRVLRNHFPDLHIESDVREVGAHNLEPVDIITFGSPCQDLSVAGKRGGFAGERSGLYFEAIRIIGELGPTIAVWENVPGALSSHNGRDFGRALDELANIGALDIGWRVLDAQWFGVAQRRRRVFVVADFRGQRAAEILALADGLSGHPAPRRAQGQGATTGTVPSLTASGRGVERAGESRGQDPVIPMWWDGGDNAASLTTRSHDQFMPDKGNFAAVITPILEAGARTNGDGYRDGDGIGEPGDPMYTLQSTKQHAVAFSAPERADTQSVGANQTTGFIGEAIAFTCKDSGSDAGKIAPTLRAMPHDKTWANGGGQVAVAFAHDVAPALTSNYGKQPDNSDTSAGPNLIASQMAVRRLTPTECERLMAFPDGWTAVDGAADSTRYRQLGNSVVVNVTEWLGHRIVAALGAS